MNAYKLCILAISISLGLSLATAQTPIMHDGVIAQVGNQIILKSELDAAILTLTNQEPSLDKQALKKQALDALIVRKLQLGVANRAGIQPNESLVNAKLLEFANEAGFKTLAQFEQHLNSQQAGSYATLKANIKEEATLAVLWQTQLASSVKVSEQEIDAFLASPEGRALNKEEYRTWHFRVPFIDDVSRLSDKQRNDAIAAARRLIQHLKSGDNVELAMARAKGGYSQDLQGADTGYHVATNLPSEISTVITTLKTGQISEPIITQTGVEVVKLVDKRNSDTVIASEWQVGHILAKVDDTHNEALAIQKINELYQALQKGANFETLATTYSDDTVSANQQGSLGWVGQKQTVPEFDIVMQNTPKSTYSTPFKSQFGYHILKVYDKRTRDISEESKRAYAHEVLFDRFAPQAGEDWLQQLKANAYINIHDEYVF